MAFYCVVCVTLRQNSVRSDDRWDMQECKEKQHVTKKAEKNRKGSALPLRSLLFNTSRFNVKGKEVSCDSPNGVIYGVYIGKRRFKRSLVWLSHFFFFLNCHRFLLL